MGDYPGMIFQGYLTLAVFQAILWMIQNHTKNASTADVGWAAGMAILVGWYALNTNAPFFRKFLMYIPLLLWSIRLSFHLLGRMFADGNEDYRYAELRKKWGKKSSFNFFFIFEMQPLFNLLLSVPFFIVFLNTSPEIKAIEIMALFLWLAGFIGETVADEQLKAFKSRPDSKGKICREGLWNYSRHPNFFFEWIMWAAYFLFALGSPHGWLAVTAPGFMLFLLLKVTGIPLIEQRALQKKGEPFRHYMETTSLFVPLPRRKATPDRGKMPGEDSPKPHRRPEI